MSRILALAPSIIAMVVFYWLAQILRLIVGGF